MPMISGSGPSGRDTRRTRRRTVLRLPAKPWRHKCRAPAAPPSASPVSACVVANLVVVRAYSGATLGIRSANVIMGVLPDVRGLNGTDLFENTKILIELEKRASQFHGPGGDLFLRHHIKWPRANFRAEYAPAEWLVVTRCPHADAGTW